MIHETRSTPAAQVHSRTVQADRHSASPATPPSSTSSPGSGLSGGGWFLVNHHSNILLARTPTTMKVCRSGRPGRQRRVGPGQPRSGQVGRDRPPRRRHTDVVVRLQHRRGEVVRGRPGQQIRTLLKCESLGDVSLVTFPAYEGTDAGMRGYADGRRSRPRPPRLRPPTRTPAAAGWPRADVRRCSSSATASSPAATASSPDGAGSKVASPATAPPVNYPRAHSLKIGRSDPNRGVLRSDGHQTVGHDPQRAC